MPLFGKDKSKIVSGAVDLVTNIRGMVDDSTFTAQEKARFNLQIADATADFAKATLNENTERSKARRSLAIYSVVFFYILVVILLVLWKFDTEWFDAAKGLILEFKLPTAFIMIMAFFFGGYYLSKVPSISNKSKNKT